MGSYSASSVSSATFLAEGSMACGEVEVAQVLASLGRTNSVESCGRGGESGGWGCKGKRSFSCKRGRDGDVEQKCSLPLPFDLNLDQAAFCDEDCEIEDQTNVVVKVEADCEPAEPSSVGSVMQNGGRSRHHMSEAEKEARRVRRILANRESARQTIRRRQALYEELTRRSAELASENEDMKRQKDLAAREFQSLQTTNYSLKDKITRITGLELGKNAEVELANTVSSHIIESESKYLSNSLIFPAYVQTSEVETSRQPSQPGLRLPSEIIMPSHVNPVMLNERGDALRTTSQHIPWCILPCPWFVSMPDGVKNVSKLASLKMADKDKESLLQARHVCSPSSVIPCLRDCLTSADDCRVHQLVFRADSAQCGASPLCSSRNGLLFEHEVSEGCVSPHPPAKTGASGVVSDCGNKQSLDAGKKKMNAAAGADARKRRRELIKLKSLHYETSSKRRYS